MANPGARRSAALASAPVATMSRSPGFEAHAEALAVRVRDPVWRAREVRVYRGRPTRRRPQQHHRQQQPPQQDAGARIRRASPYFRKAGGTGGEKNDIRMPAVPVHAQTRVVGTPATILLRVVAQVGLAASAATPADR